MDLRTGIDIVDIKRIERIISSRKEQFYKKILTESEKDYLRGKKDNPKTLAGLFAAKEAVSKAVGTGIGQLSWKDIEIVHDRNGKPEIRLNENLLDLLDNENLNSIEISISHEKEYAVAFAICFFNSKKP